MNRRVLLLIVPLLISLYIYLFYRTEKTVVNSLLASVISTHSYADLRQTVNGLLPLPKYIVYSLPEALWVFCITLTSKSFYIPWRQWQINCGLIPVFFCMTLEVLQLLHFTNGRFDYVDIFLSLLFWILAYWLFEKRTSRQNILESRGRKTFVCFASYCIVYLAHVNK